MWQWDIGHEVEKGNWKRDSAVDGGTETESRERPGVWKAVKLVLPFASPGGAGEDFGDFGVGIGYDNSTVRESISCGDSTRYKPDADKSQGVGGCVTVGLPGTDGGCDADEVADRTAFSGCY